MKQILQSKTGTVILACLGGLVVAIVAWRAGAQEMWDVNRAINDIAAGRNVAKARTTLETLDNRAYVLEKLEEAVEDEDYGVRAKFNLLTTLNMLSAPKALRRALHSKSRTAQRAACWLLYGDPEAKTRCGEIAVAWLREEGADERSMAALLCKQLDLAEAQPVLLEIVGRDPRTDKESDLFKRAIDAVKEPKPKELVDRLLAMAKDATLDEEVRGIALESLQRIKDGPRDEVLALSIEVLNDPTASRVLRSKAALGLREFPEDRAWQAIEAVLLSETEQDPILQRNCLYALGQMEPKDKELAAKYLDRLKQILHDRRVYHHKYFAMRVDVATALAALNAREPITLDIMCDYLVDEDKDDKEHLVRQEAWLTLWTLTGTKFEDVPEPELWEIPPQPFPDARSAREFFFRRAHHRPGITPAQAAMVAKIAGDTARMQKARQTYQGLKGRILEQWRVEAERTEAKKEEAPPPEPPPGAPGPQPGIEKEEGSGEPEKPKEEGAPPGGK